MYGRMLFATISVAAAWGQSAAPTAEKQMEFEVASVKPSVPRGPTNANFPLGPGDVYVPNGGYFSATGFPLSVYIGFAYKIMGNQAQYLRDQLPDWVRSEPYDIQARASGNPTKDEMRLMMRSLLAERFKLAMHHEMREGPVYALVVWKPGKLGPHLYPHADDGSPCPTKPAPKDEAPASVPPRVASGELPFLCGGVFVMDSKGPGLQRAAARNINIGFMTGTLLNIGGLDRPVVDRTGLSGAYDMSVEWAPDVKCPPGEECQNDDAGPSFERAMREQLGLTLESQKGPIDRLILDHVERPSGN